MSAAGFSLDPLGEQGQWGIPVELLVPAALQPGSTRGARIPPHDKRAMKRVPGLEAAAFDNRPMTIEALDVTDTRREVMAVAGPAALVVAKMHKIGDRHDRAQSGGRDRTNDRDAHDVYRLLRAVPTSDLVEGFERLRAVREASSVTTEAVAILRRLASDVGSPLCVMAGRAERLVGSPEDVAVATWALAADVLDGL